MYPWTLDASAQSPSKLPLPCSTFAVVGLPLLKGTGGRLSLLVLSLVEPFLELDGEGAPKIITANQMNLGFKISWLECVERTRI